MSTMTSFSRTLRTRARDDVAFLDGLGPDFLLVQRRCRSPRSPRPGFMGASDRPTWSPLPQRVGFGCPLRSGFRRRRLPAVRQSLLGARDVSVGGRPWRLVVLNLLATMSFGRSCRAHPAPVVGPVAPSTSWGSVAARADADKVTC